MKINIIIVKIEKIKIFAKFNIIIVKKRKYYTKKKLNKND